MIATTISCLLFLFALTSNAVAFYEDETESVSLQANGGGSDWHIDVPDSLKVIDYPEAGFVNDGEAYFALSEGETLILEYKTPEAATSFSVSVNSLPRKSSGTAWLQTNGEYAVDGGGSKLNLTKLDQEKVFETTSLRPVNRIRLTATEGTFAFTKLSLQAREPEDCYVDEQNLVKTKVLQPKKAQRFDLNENVEIQWSVVDLENEAGDVYTKGWTRIEKRLEGEDEWTSVPNAEELTFGKGFTGKNNVFPWTCDSPGVYKFRVVWTYGKSPSENHAALCRQIMEPKIRLLESYESTINGKIWNKYADVYRRELVNNLERLDGERDKGDQSEHERLAPIIEKVDQTLFEGLAAVVDGLCAQNGQNKDEVETTLFSCSEIGRFLERCYGEVDRLKEQFVENQEAFDLIEETYPQRRKDELEQLVKKLKKYQETSSEPDGGAFVKFENSLGMKFVYIPEGSFRMGTNELPGDLAKAYRREYENPSTDLWKNEYPSKKVEISKPFYMAQTETTVAQFREFIAQNDNYRPDCEKYFGSGIDDKTGELKMTAVYNWKNPGFQQDNSHPVVDVSWNDAQEFCKWLSKKEGKKYRLPTEEEWEYACKAEKSTRYWFGDDPSKVADYENVADVSAKKQFNNSSAWSKSVLGDDGFPFTAPVGSMRKNPWGLYDISGNVSEWCQDLVDGKPVFRGGSWYDAADKARSSSRNDRTDLTHNGCMIGFRVVCDVISDDKDEKERDSGFSWSEPKYKAGINDRIIEVDWEPIDGEGSYLKAISSAKDKIVFKVVNSKTGKIYYLRTRVPSTGTSLGYSVASASGGGVFVTAVEPNSPGSHCELYSTNVTWNAPGKEPSDGSVVVRDARPAVVDAGWPEVGYSWRDPSTGLIWSATLDVKVSNHAQALQVARQYGGRLPTWNEFADVVNNKGGISRLGLQSGELDFYETANPDEIASPARGYVSNKFNRNYFWARGGRYIVLIKK